jgi:hypothetical protein
MKHQRKRPQGKTELTPETLRENPLFIAWHKENFSPSEHAEFLAGGVLPPLSEAVNNQPHETE